MQNSRRLFAAVFLLVLLSAILFLWGNLLNPVFHKEIVKRYAALYKEDPLIGMAVIKVESNFFRKAKSPRGAIGLMQIMPHTAKEIAFELKIANFKDSDLEDPELNIRFGFHHLSKLRKEFGDDVTVLSAYNAGSKNVREWLKQKNKKALEIDDIEFAETKNFVQDVLAAYQWLKRFQRWRDRINL